MNHVAYCHGQGIKRRGEDVQEKVKNCQVNCTEAKKPRRINRNQRQTQSKHSGRERGAPRKISCIKGSDYNGVSCRRLVGSAEKFCEELKEILLAKKDENCDNKTINKKMINFNRTL
jgi:hypothetical protein